MPTLDGRAYMIRRVSDQLFSLGGDHPVFNKTGRIWRTIGNVRNHLHRATYQEKVEVVEIELQVAVVHASEDVFPPKLSPVVHFQRKRSPTPACGVEGDVSSTNKRVAVSCPNCKKTRDFGS